MGELEDLVGEQSWVLVETRGTMWDSKPTRVHLLGDGRQPLCGEAGDMTRLEHAFAAPVEAELCSDCRRAVQPDGGGPATSGTSGGVGVTAVAREAAVRVDVPDAGVQLELTQAEAAAAAVAVVTVSAALGAWLT